MSLSTPTRDPVRTASLLVKAAERGDETLDAELAEVLGPHTETSVDWVPVVQALGRSLQASYNALRKAEDACADTETEYAAAQRRREDSVNALKDELRSLRITVDAVFGTKALTQLSLDRTVSGEPLALLRLGNTARDGLGELSGFPALRRGMALNVRLHEAPLGSALYELNQAVMAVRRAERAFRSACRDRDALLGELTKRGRDAVESLDKLARRASRH
ncbi:hypothetical protein [Haliangium ochraceum]|uniref:Uncharacterized protein n=1 Tax=Haliangium ochraceum (strain DSM 14365 / JCM 11303 / SMP-2) TaxID=502025 RepID=D0LRE5_HALO1|nr:hypothetical protein [Haliangium ochraceum]ACY17173.1 hypothetical protein Hoch_4682 [Haliangium ochraceum DSM 14365]